MANEFKVKNGLIIESITSASQANVLTYNSSTGLVYYTASSAIGGGTGPSTPAFPFNGNAVITGSLLVSGSGITVTGSLNASSITGSLFGTASWAQNVVTASYVTGSVFTSTNPALTASFAVTASYINGMIAKIGSASAASFTGNPKKSTVTFTTAFPTGLPYSVVVTGQDSRAWSIESVSATQFTINSNSNTAITNDTYWQAISFGEFRS